MTEQAVVDVVAFDGEGAKKAALASAAVDDLEWECADCPPGPVEFDHLWDEDGEIVEDGEVIS